MKKHFKPTESELEILRILWDQGSSTVRTIHEQLSTIKDVFYTTTLKTMQVMHEKGLLKRDTSTRSHIYTAAVSSSVIQKNMIQKFKDTVFGGSTEQLILSALGTDKPSKKDLEMLKSIIDKLEDDAV